MTKTVKSSQKNEAKLYNIRVAECIETFQVQQFNGPYIGANLLYPEDFKKVYGLRFYVNMEFDAAETYKQIYKIVVADEFYEADRTEENTIIGPFLADGNSLEKVIDLTPFIVNSQVNYVIIYANDIHDSISAGWWTLDTDTKLNSFLIEGWYETDEH